MIQDESAISVQGLKKSYKNIPVLTGVDFQVKAGSIFALLGSNGAGSTLHEGRIIVSGTLEELKKLYPPAKMVL